jgi:hypothetical protein
MDSWSDETFQSFPHLLLLSKHRPLFSTRVLTMLLASLIEKLGKPVLQALDDADLSVLERIV